MAKGHKQSVDRKKHFAAPRTTKIWSKNNKKKQSKPVERQDEEEIPSGYTVLSDDQVKKMFPNFASKKPLEEILAEPENDEKYIDESLDEQEDGGAEEFKEDDEEEEEEEEDLTHNFDNDGQDDFDDDSIEGDGDDDAAQNDHDLCEDDEEEDEDEDEEEDEDENDGDGYNQVKIDPKAFASKKLLEKLSKLPWKSVKSEQCKSIRMGMEGGLFIGMEELDGSHFSQITTVGPSFSSISLPLPSSQQSMIRDINVSVASSAKKRAEKDVDKVEPPTKKQKLSATDNKPLTLTDSKGETTKQKKKEKKMAQKPKSQDDSDHDKPQDKDENSHLGEEAELDMEQLEKDGSEWLTLTNSRLDRRILRSLVFNCKFTEPTDVQREALRHAIVSRKDLMIASPTGSGKTLSFGIPILHLILETLEQEQHNQQPENTHKDAPAALILSPTRELALQITQHLLQAAKHTSIQIVPVIGGMARQKQERLLSYKPEIIVATPGRFWDLYSTGQEYLQNVSLIRFLVIDEADRMVENGHFQDLTSILEVLPKWSSSSDKIAAAPQLTEQTSINDWEDQTKIFKPKLLTKRQTIVCSATLTKSQSLLLQMQREARQASLKKTKKRAKKAEEGAFQPTGETLDVLLQKIDFQRPRKIIDLTPKKVTAAQLTECKLFCLKNEKDNYLYYFLMRHPGRTIIFVNSIDCLKRLSSILAILRLPIHSLHAKMQQRARLKNLDRFKNSDDHILIASDVAARGLDIPEVDYIIHYQIPKTSEVYVHRSGRTARASKKGMSLMLISPEDKVTFKKILSSLSKELDDVRDIPVEVAYMPIVQKRLRAATKLELALHHKKKSHNKTDWLVKMAEEADLDIDEDILSDDDDDETKSKKVDREDTHILELKNRLRDCLSQPFLPKGTSRKFITSDLVRKIKLD